MWIRFYNIEHKRFKPRIDKSALTRLLRITAFREKVRDSCDLVSYGNPTFPGRRGATVPTHQTVGGRTRLCVTTARQAVAAQLRGRRNRSLTVGAQLKKLFTSYYRGQRMSNPPLHNGSDF